MFVWNLGLSSKFCDFGNLNKSARLTRRSDGYLTLGVFLKRSLAKAILLFLAPAFSFAAPTGNQLIEAKDVLANREIAAHLRIEKKMHNLVCEKMSVDDVKITQDGTGVDAFEVIYSCNDKTFGANVQRIHFTGGVYLQSPKATKADVILTGMVIELSE